MAYEAMGFEMRDNIAWVTFNRPDALNAINAQATHEFYDIVNRISSDHSVRCVVLTGSGDRAFCAGMDMKEAIPLLTSGDQGSLRQVRIRLDEVAQLVQRVVEMAARQTIDRVPPLDRQR